MRTLPPRTNKQQANNNKQTTPLSSASTGLFLCREFFGLGFSRISAPPGAPRNRPLLELEIRRFRPVLLVLVPTTRFETRRNTQAAVPMQRPFRAEPIESNRTRNTPRSRAESIHGGGLPNPLRRRARPAVGELSYPNRNAIQELGMLGSSSWIGGAFCYLRSSGNRSLFSVHEGKRDGGERGRNTAASATVGSDDSWWQGWNR